MPIIYIKNPKSGSHFRHIGPADGGKGGRYTGRRRAPERQRITGIRSVGWASCNTAFQNAVRWGKGGGGFSGTIHAPQWTFWQQITGSGHTSTITGQEARRPRAGAEFSQFKKPCR
jgi:hypothetical protein